MSTSRVAVAVSRADIVDRLDTAYGTAVLVGTPGGHRVARLSVLGSVLLDVLDEAGEPVGLDVLTQELVRRLGEPEGVDPVVAVWQAVQALVDEHVVVAES